MLNIIGIIDCNTTAVALKGNIQYIINATSTINETIVIIFNLLLFFCFLNAKTVQAKAITVDNIIPKTITKNPPISVFSKTIGLMNIVKQ